MNAIAEPFELLEAECNAQGLYDTAKTDEALCDPIDETCSERVLGWVVDRIFASCIGTRTAPAQSGN